MRKDSFKCINSRIKKAVLLLGVGLFVAGTGMANVEAAGSKIVGYFENHPVYDNKVGGQPIIESANSDLERYGASFPSKYDPRIGGKITAIEDQGSTNTCWAFSAIAAIEQNLIKKGYANRYLNLSENHLAYFFYNRATDKLGYTSGDYNKAVTSNWIDNGGTIQGTAISLTTWSGVVKQTYNENYSNGGYMPRALSAKYCYNSDYRVKSVYMYNYSINGIKQAITKYGAVASGMYISTNSYEYYTYYNEDTGAYYYPYDDGNHAITIVGWDDNYAVSNFNSECLPPAKGAWIVKNSYGTSFGDNGYMYISYYDESLQEIVAYDMEPSTAYNNYQHDGSAAPLAVGLSNGSYVANIFKANATTTGAEKLTAVSLNTFQSNVKYTVQIYKNLRSYTNPMSGTPVFSTAQSGTLTDPGYQRIVLKQPVTLSPGEKYSVVIKVYGVGDSSVSIGADATYDASWIRFYSNAKAGQSFYYDAYDRCWEYAQDGGQYFNLRIKAFTQTVQSTQNIKYAMNKTAMYLSKGSLYQLAVKFSPSYNTPIYWSSSNQRAVKVTSTGKIGGMGIGTSVITAKFKINGAWKSVKCTVVVGPTKINKVVVKGGKGRLNVAWTRCSDATGYVVYVSKNKNSGYASRIINNKYTNSWSNGFSAGTYYVMMRPYYRNANGGVYYGDYTPVQAVKVY